MRKFKSICFLFILCILLSCEGQDCIEANDFGEWDEETFPVESTSTACSWADSEVSYGTGDASISSCLTGNSINSVDVPSTECTLKLSNGISCMVIKDCLLSSTSDCASNYTFTGGCQSDTNSKKKEYLKLAYSNCVEICQQKCIASKGELIYEIFPISNPGNNITITPGSTIYVQAGGKVSLNNGNEIKYDFGENSVLNSGKYIKYTINNEVYGANSNLTSLHLEGNWCKSGSLSTCTSANQVGEFNNIKDIQKRQEFLRRGVLILKDAPNIGSINSSNIYEGPYQTADDGNPSRSLFNSWTCDYNTDSYNISSYQTNLRKNFSCSTNYNENYGDEYGEYYIKKYPMENNFVKKNGGYVIPENVQDYILTNPFSDIVGFNNEGERRVTDVSSRSFQVYTKSSYKEMRSGYLVGKNGINVTLNYPSKLAFMIVKNNNEYASGSCSVKVSVSANSNINNGKKDENGILVANGELVVPADGYWHFMLDNTNGKISSSTYLSDNDSRKRLIISNSYFDSLNKIKNTDEQNIIEYPTSSNVKVTISVDSNETYKIGSTQSNMQTIPCGDGLVAFFIPLNEVLVEKSGFVSFKNLLVKNYVPCSNDAISGLISNSDACVNYNEPINFTIINPLYDYVNGRTYTEYELEENFYEYREANWHMTPKIQSINMSYNNSNWSDEVFVRNGQILRFSEDTFFSITRPNNATTDNTFDIKNKVVYSDNVYNSIGLGLFMKIRERPALFCSGVGEESFENLDCVKSTDSDGNTYCEVDYSNSSTCGSTSTYSSDYTSISTTYADASRYCPYGCYYEGGVDNGAFYVSKSAKQGSCAYTKELASQLNGNGGINNKEPKISLATCKACQKYIEEASSSKKVEENLDVIQCYDLENYKGSFLNLFVTSTNSDNEISLDNITMYGNLTKLNYSLGARKLDSIFSTSTYGNLSGMDFDVNSETITYVNEVGIKASNPKTLHFLLLDNDDFLFSNSSDKAGKYNFFFSKTDTIKVGTQMSVFIANKNFSGRDSEIKAKLVTYSTDTTDIEEYGKELDSPYTWNSSGILVNKSTKRSGVVMSDISQMSTFDVKDSEFKDLRLWFKIVDKPDFVGCNISDPSSDKNLNKMYVRDTEILCYCPGESEERADECSSKQCGTDSEGNVINPTSFSKPICKSIYSDNTGVYNVLMKTEKDSDLILKSTTIVKFVMNPILKILDGTYKGFVVNNNGELIPCQVSESDQSYQVKENDYFGSVSLAYKGKYGGIFPNDSQHQIGGRCSPTDLQYGIYCLKTTNPSYCKGASSNNPIYCFLPGADSSKLGTACNKGYDMNSDGNDLCYFLQKDICASYKVGGYASNDDSFGTSCNAGDPNCWKTCETLDTNLYSTNCKYINDGRGWLERFYVAVISDSGYQTILKLSLTLMITFYGMYYLLGLAEFSYKEFINRAFKIAFIYLMVGTRGWYYYNMFFVKFFKGGFDYLTFAIASSFDNSAELEQVFLTGNFYDRSVLFSGVDRVLTLIFSKQLTYKVWGLFFISFFGWLYVFLIYSSILAYITSVANSILLYLTGQFFISLLLSFGPIFFVLLIFDKTKGMFTKWINNLIGFGTEQVLLLSCLSLFNTFIYQIIKFVVSYRVCWRGVWTLNIPIIGRVTLLHFWKATSASDPSSAANAVPGLFHILLIYITAELMSDFIKLMADLGNSLGGGSISSSAMSGDIAKAAGEIYKTVAGEVTGLAKKGATAYAKTVFGYKTKEEEKKDEEMYKKLRSGKRKAEKAGEEAVEKWKSEHLDEFQNMSIEERDKKLSEIYDKAYDDEFSNNKEFRDALIDYNAMRRENGEAEIKSGSDMRKLNPSFNDGDGLVGSATTAIVSGIRSTKKEEVIEKYRGVSKNEMNKFNKEKYNKFKKDDTSGIDWNETARRDTEERMEREKESARRYTAEKEGEKKGTDYLKSSKGQKEKNNKILESIANHDFKFFNKGLKFDGKIDENGNVGGIKNKASLAQMVGEKLYGKDWEKLDEQQRANSMMSVPDAERELTSFIKAQNNSISNEIINEKKNEYLEKEGFSTSETKTNDTDNDK